ncbi:MAG: VTT domain-containing protein [Bacteroidales bacterium]|nr:VTT domain-containing protein [Bacteroidales bacterium]
MVQISINEKARFFLSNFLKGLLWLIILIVVFVLARKHVNPDFNAYLQPFLDNTPLILTIYCLSEFLLGIIPPEMFMIWALKFETLNHYIFYVTLFSLISYIAGTSGFLFGKYLNNTRYYRYLRRRFLGKYHSLLTKYGFFLILVAALTPLPFSAISILVGSLNYPAGKYLLYALSRFPRYAVYAFIIWESGLL